MFVTFFQLIAQRHSAICSFIVVDEITECFFSFFSNSLGTPFYPSQPVYQSAPIIVPTQQQPPPAKREKKTVRDLYFSYFNIYCPFICQISLPTAVIIIHLSPQMTAVFCSSLTFSPVGLEDLYGYMTGSCKQHLHNITFQHALS